MNYTRRVILARKGKKTGDMTVCSSITRRVQYQILDEPRMSRYQHACRASMWTNSKLGCDLWDASVVNKNVHWPQTRRVIL